MAMKKAGDQEGARSHCTFASQASFASWIKGVCGTLGVRHIPVDGQTLRGTRGTGRTCLHRVSAWAAEHRLTLAQVAVEDKSNEIVAIPKVLALLDLKGALVSIDAIGCQKTIAAQIREGGGDYLLAVKDNQPTLRDDIGACFLQAYLGRLTGVGGLKRGDQGFGHPRSRQVPGEQNLEHLPGDARWCFAQPLDALVAHYQAVWVQPQGQTSTRLAMQSRSPLVLATGIGRSWAPC